MFPLKYTIAVLVGVYILIVRSLRYRRCKSIQSKFSSRPLSSMTAKEAHGIFRELRELEFPYSLHNSMGIALLKTSAIPTIAKLLSATGQLSEKNASKRGADTEIILMEAHDREPGSDSHLNAIARMNYLHARYRKAGKILDEDMLHTLGSPVVEIIRAVNDNEWRTLSEVEICAVGVFHKCLGEAMEIPFTLLPSSKTGWKDGAHFARELYDWTLEYEHAVANPTHSTVTLGRRFLDIPMFNVPTFLRPVAEGIVGTKLDRHMRVSMGFPDPGYAIQGLAMTIKIIRPFILRHFSVPRPEFMAVHALNESPDPVSGMYTINFYTAHPWYVKPTAKHRWGLRSWFIRLFGSGIVPGTSSGLYRESGYDLKSIGPAAQEKKGAAEMEETVERLRKGNYASACPFAV
ncbi:hypothetical protein ASPWEDRAFT_120396 [Aspergillus wentii DTO 134E9]|uniref:ER-bound oxygenase mpaB/mpaB'/Rubber oxygenase catalytic domain-containing protein n=1 Tax=Aspergillus wentii DTO 134E9 TaxID=1073089 RepID=A0A1L9R5D1_ASPWE|nr:uncharacterized protein ASPWEDRAFT_120396 [Aspergillus wentii DTO 134E9]KAI9923761.1 hypothetical protein MW887_008388 [Aspergillus wentii]OJJ30119.1 hypothetical protein ASPWEDRAFT_120396 [Aspergillus wentii DTO 134E9]